MAKIRIVSIPSGQAPEEIRMAWVGIVIPLGDQTPGILHGVLGGEADARNKNGYSVKTADAIAALEAAGQDRAATWWRNNKFTSRPDAQLVFGAEFCELLLNDLPEETPYHTTLLKELVMRARGHWISNQPATEMLVLGSFIVQTKLPREADFEALIIAIRGACGRAGIDNAADALIQAIESKRPKPLAAPEGT